MSDREPAPELAAALAGVTPGRALDLACGAGRHAIWLAARGWLITAVDREMAELPGIEFIQADFECGEFTIEPSAWDLIVSWLYWQPGLLPNIASGVRSGGIVAMAGKTTGRFAVSLERMRAGFDGWKEIASGENQVRVFLIVRRD